MKIDNTVAAIVTGGASGLGKASAEALAAAGAKVAIFDINEAAGEAVAKEIGGIFCKVDITSEDSALAGFAKARAAHGQERVLVHCAMTSKRGKTLALLAQRRAEVLSIEERAQRIEIGRLRTQSVSIDLDGHVADDLCKTARQEGLIPMTLELLGQFGRPSNG